MILEKLPYGIQLGLSTIASTFIILAVVPYLIAIIRKQVKPRPLTWIGWTLLAGTIFISQVLENGFVLNQIVAIISIIGCLLVFILSFKNKNIEKMDWFCLLLGIICLCIYIVTKNSWIATILAIFADMILAIPTLNNAWKNPLSEKSKAWTLGAIAYAITIIACKGHNIIYVLFPIYLFCFNFTMILFTRRKI